jgi:hypothetical protein
VLKETTMADVHYANVRAKGMTGTPMPSPLKFVLAGYVVAMFFLVLYFLIKLWPMGAGDKAEIAQFFWGPVTLPPDVRLILIAAFSGALGAYVHLATSFADYAGNDWLTLEWAWWYLLRPFIGAALAEVVYLAIRAGLVNVGTGGASASVISPYGVAAMTALTGLFSKQATDKLREVFETLFHTQEKVRRSDPLPMTPTPPDKP